MILVPYKLDADLRRVPFLTLLVIGLCIFTFVSQLQSQARTSARMQAFCTTGLSMNQRAIVEHIDDERVEGSCESVFTAVRRSTDPDTALATLAGESNLDLYGDPAQDELYRLTELQRAWLAFQQRVPEDLTERLEYRPGELNIPRMLTSTFAHGSPLHLIGNLFFFFAFASCVECVLGPAHFMLCFLLMAIVSSLTFSSSAAGATGIPAIGLSGVCMGMMAMLTVLLPRAKMWCFFWFLIWVRRFALPVLLIAVWYIGWNVYDLRHDSGSDVNYAAHVGGAVAGIVLGTMYRMLAAKRVDAVAAVADLW